jgi:hypothetical protein
MSALPLYVQIGFPFIFSKRTGIHISVMRMMKACLESSMGIASFRKMLREKYMLKYDEWQLSYVASLQSLMFYQKSPTITQFKITNDYRSDQLREFSSFSDEKGYMGRLPSGTFLVEVC